MPVLWADMTDCSPEHERPECISVAEDLQTAFTPPEVNGQRIHSSLDALQGTNYRPNKFLSLEDFSFQRGLQFA